VAGAGVGSKRWLMLMPADCLGTCWNTTVLYCPVAGSNTSSVVYSGELGPPDASCGLPDGCGKFRMAVSKLSDGLNCGDGVVAEDGRSVSGDI